ncbi:MAG: hypothetical protein Q9166_002368 [cf. Caloplaca sp. 2 TL-2023]
MSIDIDWDGLTTGPSGLELAGSIRDFIHDKFQQVQLPRFIRSVEVHSFDFGKECPVVELKDICDPLAEFYEDDDEGSEHEEDQEEEVGTEHGASIANPHNGVSKDELGIGHGFRPPPFQPPSNHPTPLDTRFLPSHRFNADLSRSSTPGIPGGTSNLSYFHLPLSAGLSGTTTPLAAVAGGSANFSAGWPDATPYAHLRSRQHSPVRQPPPLQSRSSYADPSSRSTTADSFLPTHAHHHDTIPNDSDPSPIPHPSSPNPSPPKRQIDPDPNDLQIVLRITYTGSVQLSMTAEILLDYPMSSFVGIPLKLNITGLSFDGVALIAYLRKRAHFCFLGPDDARTLVGSSGEMGDDHAGDGLLRGTEGRKDGENGLGGLLREIRVESEIGRQENGKQVLRNVGKVEKFVLEQVRRIFEEEFVWPSFWTFLV